MNIVAINYSYRYIISFVIVIINSKLIHRTTIFAIVSRISTPSLQNWKTARLCVFLI